MDVYQLIPKDKRQYCFALPGPAGKQLPGTGDFVKYWVDRSDCVATCEGGMMHLAYNMGKPLLVVMKEGNMVWLRPDGLRSDSFAV